MNILLERRIIGEAHYGDDSSYILEDNSIFSPTEYRVLQSQKSGNFVTCRKMLLNGKIQLYYLCSTYKNLASLIPTLSAEAFLQIVSNLLSNIIEVRNNGFLSCQNIDISFDHIYIDQSNFQVKLLYLPLNMRLFNEYGLFENELRTSIVKILTQTRNLHSSKALQFIPELSNGNIDLEGLNFFLKCGNKSQDGPSDVTSFGDEKRPYLISLDARNSFEVEITKDSFVVGKKQEIVDGVVSFNKMISRSHCKITKNTSGYYVTDLQSANGTYINNVRLQPNVPMLIRSGDSLRLANSNFQFVLK